MHPVSNRGNWLVLVLLASLMALTGRAELISGGFQFIGSATLDSSSAASATAVTSWNAFVFGPANSGDFASPAPYALTDGEPIAFTPSNWYFNTSYPITNFWSVGGFNFELQASAISSQGGMTNISGYVSVSGTGVVTGNGYEPTAFTWQFITSDPSIGSAWLISGGVASLGTNGAPVLNAQTIGTEIVLSWVDPAFTLQTAAAVEGPFTNVPAATSPYTNTFPCDHRFFRLNQ